MSDPADRDLRVNTDLPFEEFVRKVMGTEIEPGDENPDDDDQDE